MQNHGFFRGVFLVAALYDLVLGLVFFLLFLKGARGLGEGQNQNPEVTV